MKSTIVFFLFSLSVVLPVFGQINQTSPELCGKSDGAVPLPPTLRVSIDESIGQGDLYLDIGGVAQKISLPGVVNEIDEVCPISNGRFVVFSFTQRGGLGEIDIIDSVHGLLLDSIWGYSPLMSPDQRWLVYRKFYPRHTDLPVSDEYLLYDLTKSPAQNRPPGIALSDIEDVGAAIFPLGQKNLEGDNLDLLPPDQLHSHDSEFFWASDSRAVAFGDIVQQKLSIVLVTLGNRGDATASVYPVTHSGDCGSTAVAGNMVFIDQIEVGNQDGEDRSIRVDFSSAYQSCSPKPIIIHGSDFQTPKIEVHVRPKRKGSIVDPQ